jgi:hypothetical protein
MTQDLPQPIEEPAAGTNGHRLPSLDFRGQHELDWSKIEGEIHALSARAMAVEMIGRTAQDDIHGERLGHVFDALAEDISGAIERLKDLLGLDKGVRT